MSELRTVKLYEMNEIKLGLRNDGLYFKSEADKVIAELKKERIWLAKDRAQAYDDLEKREQLNIKQEESNRHQKYKRCLAMADFCESQYDYCNAVGNGFWLVRGDIETRDKYRKKADNFWWKWHKRWLELAEQFKDVK